MKLFYVLHSLLAVAIPGSVFEGAVSELMTAITPKLAESERDLAKPISEKIVGNAQKLLDHEPNKIPGLATGSFVRGVDKNGNVVEAVGFSQGVRAMQKAKLELKSGALTSEQKFAEIMDPANDPIVRANELITAKKEVNPAEVVTHPDAELRNTLPTACNHPSAASLGFCAEHDAVQKFIAAGGVKVTHSAAFQFRENAITAVERCKNCRQFDLGVPLTDDIQKVKLLKLDKNERRTKPMVERQKVLFNNWQQLLAEGQSSHQMVSAAAAG